MTLEDVEEIEKTLLEEDTDVYGFMMEMSGQS